MDNFVKTLIEEVKSQGVFDEFRFNCCLADVDTKPAYQNVRNRVETAVNDFLAKQHWTPDTNKVQLRERLRKHLLDSDVLDKGVDHIVDQVVNPKVATIFEPKIESIAYKYLGITPPPPPTNPPPRPPLLPAPPLPPYSGHPLSHMNGGNLLKVETTASLLPTDLEQISPDSDRDTVKSDLKDDSKDDDLPPGVDVDDMLDDDDDAASPPFEPIASFKEDTNNASLNTSDSLRDIKELANDSRDAGASQASQLSQVSSDSRLTIASMDAPQPTSANNSVELTSNMAANISEEAQMPKFSENSSDGNDDISGRQLHFDIKQDAITFEGTERKSSLSENTNGGTHTLSIEDAIMCEVTANLNNDNHISSERDESKPKQLSEANCERSSDSYFASFADSAPGSQNHKDCLAAIEPPLPQEPPPELPNADKAEKQQVSVEDAAAATLPIASDELKDDGVIKTADLTTSPASASSSSQTHKKSSHSHSKDKDKRHHSHTRSDDKQRRKSRERDRERDKSHSKTSSSSKHSSHNSSHSSSSKHRTSSSSRNEKSSNTSTASSRSTHESSTSSKRSSSRHESSSLKKHKSSSSSSRSDRDRERSRDSRESHGHSNSHHSRSHNGSGSSSSASKRSDRDRERDRNKSSSNSTSNPASTSITAITQDDHYEEKAKLLKRHSNDSNDEGKPPDSSNKPPTETTDAPSKESKERETVAVNGKEPESNGTHDNHNQSSNQTTAELMAASSVIIVSDILQESSVSFVEINSAGASLKTTTEVKITTTVVETELKPEEQTIEITQTESTSKSPAQVDEPETITASEPPAAQPEITNELNDTMVDPVEDPIEEPVVEEVEKTDECEKTTDEIEVVRDQPEVADSARDSPIEPDKTVDSEEPLIPADTAKSEIDQESSESLAETEIGETFTHFEDDAEQFRARLQLIEQHIKDRRQLLDVFIECEETSCPRRSTFKRRLSSEASTSKHHSSSSAGSSSSCAGSPAKRTRRTDAVKTSPTPSEISVNSKENEELEKHEKDVLTTRRLAQKLCQQQRYSNDDLYKPRPLLSQRSRRRGLDSIL
ncbi:serine-aspartate repeat-containing protein F [Drosophila grimshawi]|uniref:GH18411 n=1 Tax=Drosophila grimshawi TaxID=7222 RepID=B4JEQ2_DROGR|nr:serine-aspartate repeat-containing protein F [Drosophila grimshawi]EDV93183.1 GH18411 [Drosophila grimshawi]